MRLAFLFNSRLVEQSTAYSDITEKVMNTHNLHVKLELNRYLCNLKCQLAASDADTVQFVRRYANLVGLKCCHLKQ